MNIGIIVAMDSEYDLMLNALGGTPDGTIGSHTVHLRRSGMGKVNAAVAATVLIRDCHPDCLLSTGVAGALDPSLKGLDAVVSREIVYHDAWYGEGNAYGQIQGFPARFQGDPALLAVAERLGARPGLFCSGDWFVDTDEVHDRILRDFPDGIAVDMESAALAQTCHIHGIPFLSFRLISDTAEDHAGTWERFWQEVGPTSFRLMRDFLLSL
ncbi:MAG: 5'-methylthioadenosine/S-adenosylhomocysteine nucleosidase [Bacteroidota bacterium]|nr:5'-methylthioadenosine/S-adenosylhomocysteine nucleosidase [Bacteroidota bacterium]